MTTFAEVKKELTRSHEGFPRACCLYYRNLLTEVVSSLDDPALRESDRRLLERIAVFIYEEWEGHTERAVGD